MKINKSVLHASTFIGVITFTFNVQAKEINIPVNDLQDTIKVEVIDTHIASPDKIIINKLKDNLQVVGVIKRKGHKNQPIRGHVDIELLNSKGEIIENQMKKFRNLPGTAKHDHQREFSASFHLPEFEGYRLAIRHHLYMKGH